jgi:hypothetical protein
MLAAFDQRLCDEGELRRLADDLTAAQASVPRFATHRAVVP